MEWRLEGKRVSTISPLSSYSPRGPLDDRLLKTSIYSDSDTDLASQDHALPAHDQELEQGDSRNSLDNCVNLTASDDVANPDLFEPAPFQSTSRKGRYVFPLPRVRLGAGVNGVVDKVLLEDADTGTKEPYAVKVLTPPEPPPCPNPLYRRQVAQHEQEVLAEIRLLELVRGLPHVVQLADHCKAADGTFYIVMEYLQGQSLDELIKLESDGFLHLSWSVKRDMIKQLAEALAACHKEGVFHGDFKPHNVMARRWVDDGTDKVAVTLLDFGAGCLVKGSTGQLPPGQGLFGSPAYMAPEQVKACLQRRDGMPRGPLYGAAADCWAFGLTMFELLTGQTLFGAKKEAPQEEWDHVEAAREFHERQIAAEHQSWASCRTPSQFEGFAAGLAKLSTSDDEYQRLACDLMWRLLRPGPHERMRSSAILKHEFFL